MAGLTAVEYNSTRESATKDAKIYRHKACEFDSLTANREGRVSPAFAFGGENVQISLLRAEGVEVSDEGYVSLERYRYLPTRKTEE